MLAMYSGQIGLFASQDLLLFFFMWSLGHLTYIEEETFSAANIQHQVVL
jgi:hypothetical protein